jgi:hypothetical protein
MNTDIREYGEGKVVEIIEHDGYYYNRPETKGRLVIIALNEGGHNSTEVDLLDVIEWVKKNKPELL